MRDAAAKCAADAPPAHLFAYVMRTMAWGTPEKVRALDAASTAVDFMDPVTVLGLAGVPAVDAIAAEVRTVLERVRDRLTA